MNMITANKPVVSYDPALGQYVVHTAANHKVLLKQYGISRMQLANSITNRMHIPASQLHCLDNYFILHYATEIFKAKCIKGTITDNRTGINYIVIYQDCTRYDVLHAAKVGNPIQCSFRNPAKVFKLPAYVIVRLSPTQLALEF